MAQGTCCRCWHVSDALSAVACTNHIWSRSASESTLALMLWEVKKNGWMIWWMFAWETLNHKFPMLIHKVDSRRRRNVNFWTWVTRLPIEMNVHVANIFWHCLTSPTNTSILSLSLENPNFKFVTLTRAASQPVALFSIILSTYTKHHVCFKVQLKRGVLRMGSSDLGLALRDLPEEKGSLEPNPLDVFEDQVPRLDMAWWPSRLSGEVGFSRCLTKTGKPFWRFTWQILKGRSEKVYSAGQLLRTSFWNFFGGYAPST